MRALLIALIGAASLTVITCGGSSSESRAASEEAASSAQVATELSKCITTLGWLALRHRHSVTVATELSGGLLGAGGTGAPHTTASVALDINELFNGHCDDFLNVELFKGFDSGGTGLPPTPTPTVIQLPDSSL